MSLSFLKILILGISAVVFVGCSGLSDMQENAKKASDNSGKAADAAEESREEIANARILGRAGEASQARREALESLIKAESFEQKATEAAKYVKAFEYQMFTGQKYDTDESYEAAVKDAMEEFFRSLVELNGNQSIVGYKFKPFHPLPGRRSRELNVYAVAAALHKVHHYRETVGKEPPPSILDVISSSLEEIQKVENGEMNAEGLKPHQVIVYRKYEETIAVLQARINMILTVALNQFSDRLKKNSTLAEGKLRPAREPYDEVSFMQLNQAQKAYTLLVLQYAIDTAEILKGQGVEPEIIPELAYHYGVLTFKSLSKESPEFQASSFEEQKTGMAFLERLRELFPEITGS